MPLLPDNPSSHTRFSGRLEFWCQASMERFVHDASKLTRYKSWANGLFFDRLSSLPAQELTVSRAMPFGRLIRLLAHVYAMDYVWQCHLLGKPHGMTSRDPGHDPELSDLAARQAKLDEWFVEYADSLCAAELASTVAFQFIGGGPGSMSRNEILLHVVNHGTYHRGHAASVLYTLGLSPPTTDLPVFLARAALDLPIHSSRSRFAGRPDSGVGC